MLYIDKSLLESLGQICNGTIPAGYNKKPVYVRIGDKVFKYGTGSFSFVTLMALTACGGTSGGGGGGGGGTGVGLERSNSKGRSPLSTSIIMLSWI